MAYFTPQEQEKTLQEFYAFDRKLIHETYTKKVDEMEKMTSDKC